MPIQAITRVQLTITSTPSSVSCNVAAPSGKFTCKVRVAGNADSLGGTYEVVLFDRDPDIGEGPGLNPKELDRLTSGNVSGQFDNQGSEHVFNLECDSRCEVWCPSTGKKTGEQTTDIFARALWVVTPTGGTPTTNQKNRPVVKATCVPGATYRGRRARAEPA